VLKLIDINSPTSLQEQSLNNTMQRPTQESNLNSTLRSKWEVISLERECVVFSRWLGFEDSLSLSKALISPQSVRRGWLNTYCNVSTFHLTGFLPLRRYEMKCGMDCYVRDWNASLVLPPCVNRVTQGIEHEFISYVERFGCKVHVNVVSGKFTLPDIGTSSDEDSGESTYSVIKRCNARELRGHGLNIPNACYNCVIEGGEPRKSINIRSLNAANVSFGEGVYGISSMVFLCYALKMLDISQVRDLQTIDLNESKFLKYLVCGKSKSLRKINANECLGLETVLLDMKGCGMLDFTDSFPLTFRGLKLSNKVVGKILLPRTIQNHVGSVDMRPYILVNTYGRLVWNNARDLYLPGYLPSGYLLMSLDTSPTTVTLTSTQYDDWSARVKALRYTVVSPTDISLSTDSRDELMYTFEEDSVLSNHTGRVTRIVVK
jgi:hypothetical protein